MTNEYGLQQVFQEELDMLQSLSCDIIQGYYFDRLMPSDDFEKRLKKKDFQK